MKHLTKLSRRARGAAQRPQRWRRTAAAGRPSLALAALVAAGALVVAPTALRAQGGAVPFGNLPPHAGPPSYVAGYHDSDALAKALAHKSRMPRLAVGGSSSSSSGGAATLQPGDKTIARIDIGQITNTKWENIGPFAMEPRYQSTLGLLNSFMSGRVNAVAYDPKNPLTFYAAAAGGGLWRTQDGGFTWTSLGDSFPVQQASAIAISPANNKVIFVGTGDFDGGSGAGIGIMRSVNGGATFVNVGQELGTVSAIVIDPESPQTILATTRNSRLTGGGIYRSTDNGNTWTDVTPDTLLDDRDPDNNPPNQPQPIGEGWSDLEISVADAEGNRFLYATNRRGGLFRSDDRGETWFRLNPPLRYNHIQPIPRDQHPDDDGTQPDFNDPYAGGYGIEVATSAVEPETVYVIDSNARFSDGRVWRSTDAGETWTEISGSFPATEGPSNNWTLSNYALSLNAVPTMTFDGSGNPVLVDTLYGGARTLAASFTGGPDWVDTMFSLGNGAQIHIDQHGLTYFKDTPNTLLVCNDGGVYQITAFPDFGFWFVSNPQINRNLVVTQFYRADWHPTNPNIVLGGTAATAAARSLGNTSDWTTIPVLNSPLAAGAAAETPAMASGIAAEPAAVVGNYVGAVAISQSNPNIQYACTGGSGGFPNKRYYVTTDNWATALDITPDRYLVDGFGQPVRVSGQNQYVFPTVAPQANTNATRWTNEAGDLSYEGLIETDPFSNAMYAGAKSLWRYDLTANPAPEPPNQNRGLWRPVGSTVLAPDAGEHITAIAISGGGNRIYVGTSQGRLWMTQNARQQDSTTPYPNLTASWTQLNGPTLPSRVDISGQDSIRRAITAISVNPDNVSSDIIVAIAGAGIYRCANTLGGSFLFTAQNGTGIASLPPGITPTAIARDTITFNADGTRGDATNSFFIGTPIGVFFTNNQGSTWQDASTPLGLPNLAVTSLKANPNTGYLNLASFGRGIWRIKLDTVEQQVLAPNLVTQVAMSRTGNTIFVTATVRNDGGTATQVRITSATMQVGTTTTPASSINPSLLGTIGTGPQSAKSATLTFPASIGGKGVSANLVIQGTYNGGTFGLNLRTRLP